MTETLTCVCCGAEIHREDACFVGDQPVCRDCADAETFICDNCGFRHWDSDNQGDDRHDLCPTCREEYFVACSECGRLIPNSEAWYEEDADDTPPYCEACYREKMGDTLHSYSYKPCPIFYGGGPLYLGVELEVDGAGQSASHARTVLDVINRRAEYAYMKTDGSLDDGLELVTHPCTLEEHCTNVPWADTVAAFREMHYNSHNAGTCGLHVHVNRSALGEHSAAQDETFAKILYLFERFWQEILRFSRRTESQMNHWAARYGYQNSAKEILEHAKYDSGNGRYACVNLTNHDTIEFRAFRGTLKRNTLIATLQFVDRICRVALALSKSEIKDLSWPEFVLHLTKTRIETDSYVAVQMLASARTLDLASLAGIAEQLEGTFTLTILDKQDNLYFVRGNNPLCLVEFPRLGLFVYASTAEILQDAIARLDFLQAQPFSRVWLEEGEILRLSADGRIETLYFDTRRLHSLYHAPWGWQSHRNAGKDFSEDLLNTACNLGFEEEDAMILQGCGYCPDEIEELLQDPELFRAALQESYYEYAMHQGDWV